MIKKFNRINALEYCKNSDVNMLVADKDYSDPSAVFKLYSVSEDLLMHYFDAGQPLESDKRIISPEQLEQISSPVIFLDTSEIIVINGQYLPV